MAETPKGFERATGKIEGRRRCLSRACGKLYPVTDHDLQAKCPHCGSGNTADAQAAVDAARPNLRLVRD